MTTQQLPRMTQHDAAQPTLARPVCMDGGACTLLKGHSGKHTSPQGKQW